LPRTLGGGMTTRPAGWRVVRATAPDLARRRGSLAGDARAFAVIAAALILAHLPLLRLPYFWDEAGYYIPAARDLLFTGALIPHSTATNAHPPLVIAWLALAWKIFGVHFAVTRVAMLLSATLGLTAVFRIAREVANREVAIATTLCTALYPIVFVQSSLAHLDMAAAALTLWALAFYLESRIAAAVVFFSLAALAKETAVITPVALCAWEVVCRWIQRRRGVQLCAIQRKNELQAFWLLVPILPLASWFAYHWSRTGYLLGNPGFFHYNIVATLSPVRIVLAFGERLWQLLAHMNMYVLTIAAAAAMLYPALPEQGSGQSSQIAEMRPRIGIPVQLVFLVVIAAQVMAMSVIGGALLTRYVLPAYPLVILLCVSTVRRRIALWRWAIAIVCFGFVLALLSDPPYRFSPEDNLTYRDFILVHRDAAQVLSSRYVGDRVLTAWPATDELLRPWLGYANRPIRVTAIENFSAAEVEAAKQRHDFDCALVFSANYEPPGGSLLDGISPWMRLQERYFDLHRDVTAEEAAQILGSRVEWIERRGGEWAAIIKR
jgi:4-amino-4-deoxy-L-arabinose transferase-like glycosyltransferase